MIRLDELRRKFFNSSDNSSAYKHMHASDELTVLTNLADSSSY